MAKPEVSTSITMDRPEAALAMTMVGHTQAGWGHLGKGRGESKLIYNCDAVLQGWGRETGGHPVGWGRRGGEEQGTALMECLKGRLGHSTSITMDRPDAALAMTMVGHTQAGPRRMEGEGTAW